MSAARLRVTMHPTKEMLAELNIEPDSWETDAEQFVAENELDTGDETDRADAEWLRTMPVGSDLRFGGGAGPLIVVTRIT